MHAVDDLTTRLASRYLNKVAADGELEATFEVMGATVVGRFEGDSSLERFIEGAVQEKGLSDFSDANFEGFVAKDLSEFEYRLLHHAGGARMTVTDASLDNRGSIILSGIVRTTYVLENEDIEALWADSSVVVSIFSTAGLSAEQYKQYDSGEITENPNPVVQQYAKHTFNTFEDAVEAYRSATYTADTIGTHQGESTEWVSQPSPEARTFGGESWGTTNDSLGEASFVLHSGKNAYILASALGDELGVSPKVSKSDYREISVDLQVNVTLSRRDGSDFDKSDLRLIAGELGV